MSKQLILVLTITLILIDLTSELRLNPKGPTHGNFAVKCLTEIARHNFKQKSFSNITLLTILATPNMTTPAHQIQEKIIRELNILSEWNIDIYSGVEIKQFAILHGNDTDINSNNDIRSNFYIIIVDSLENFDEKFRFLVKMDNCNKKALVVVYYSKRDIFFKDIVKYILLKFWNNLFNNVLILIPKTLIYFDLYTFTYNNIKGGNCLDNPKLNHINTCESGVLLKNNRNYVVSNNRETHSDLFKNCSINVIATIIEPFIINEKEGFEISVLNQIGAILNISFNITTTDDDTWGEKLENGYWSDSLGLIYNESYIGIGNVYPAPKYREDFEFSAEYYKADLNYIVPAAQLIPKWRVLTIIFSWELWSFCIGYMIASGVLLYLTAKAHNNEFNTYKKFSDDMLVSLGILIMSPIFHQPRSDLTRLVFVAIAIFSIIISSVYTSSLINYLTNPQREPQIDSIQEVLRRGLDIGGFPVYRNIFNVTDDEIAMRVLDVFQTNESLDIWMSSVADDRDTCTVFNDLFIKYKIAHKDRVLTDTKNRSKVHIIKDKIFSYSLMIIAKKGFPFMEAINHAIGEITNAGLVWKMAEKYDQDAKKADFDDNRSFVQPLTLDHLQGAFAVLIIGYICGVAALLLEILNKFCKKCCNKVKK